MYQRIKLVSSFDELSSTPFRDGVNALCWRRSLRGDYAEVIARLDVGDEIIALDPESLQALRPCLGDAGQLAIDAMIADYRLLEGRGLAPSLDCIPAYARSDADALVRTDVYSFHVDRAPIKADTWLCTYAGAPSEGLANEAATRHVDIPHTRAALCAEYAEYQGSDAADFADYLRARCYDLHYLPHQDARPYSFGVGHLWRIAIDYPGCPVPPCIHRAPQQKPGDPARLLLIS